MAAVVINTRPIASVLMVLIWVRNSLNEILNAASYSRGGRNRSIMISGSKATSGMVGINPIQIPSKMSRIGAGNFILSAIPEAAIIMAMIMSMLV
ncbi:hypothetical protein D3C86_1559430 [compost metagenome]